MAYRTAATASRGEGLAEFMELKGARIDATLHSVVVFSLDDCQYALPLGSVQRCLRVVGIAPVPDAPAIMLGIVNLGGTVTPVIDVRSRFDHPAREVRLTDHLIVATATERTVALLVDAIEGVMDILPESYVPADEIMPQVDCIEGIIKLEDGMVLIHDLERLLSPTEKNAVDRAVSAASDENAPAAAPAAATPEAARRNR